MEPFTEEIMSWEFAKELIATGRIGELRRSKQIFNNVRMLNINYLSNNF